MKQKKNKRKNKHNNNHKSKTNNIEYLETLNVISGIRHFEFASCLEVTNILGSEKRKKLGQAKDSKKSLNKLINKEYDIASGLGFLHAGCDKSTIEKKVDFYIEIKKYKEERLEKILIDINSYRIIIPDPTISLDEYSRNQKGTFKAYASKINTMGKFILGRLLELKSLKKVSLSEALDPYYESDAVGLLYNNIDTDNIQKKTGIKMTKDYISSKLDNLRGLVLEVDFIWKFNKYLDNKMIYHRHFSNISKSKREIDLLILTYKSDFKKSLLRMEKQKEAEIYIKI